MHTKKIINLCISCALTVMVLVISSASLQPVAAQYELPPPVVTHEATVLSSDRVHELLPIIKAALDQATGLVQSAHVRIDDVRLETGRLTVDMNPDILDPRANTDIEEVLTRLAQAVSNLDIPELQRLDFYFTVGGQSADVILLAKDAAMIKQLETEKPGSITSADTNTIRAPSAGPLAGRKIAISAGHGWYWNVGASAWRLARGDINGVVEDYVNAEIAAEVVSLLQSAGATVFPVREPNFNAGNGASSRKPKWQEGGALYAKSQGAPESVWNTGAVGGTMDVGEKRDVNSRALYANWRATDILVSIHNNAGGGVGTEIWYDTNNGQQANSLSLANSVLDRLLNRLRGDYQSNWNNRTVKGSNGGYGENRSATRPAIIVEVAFMDNTSNNAALKDGRFKQIAAQGIYEGILKYFGATNVGCPSISNWKGEYYNGRIPNGTLTVCRDDSNVNFNWGEGAPAGGVAVNNFSARWTRTLYFDAGTYRFHLKGDDGIRLWVDGNLLIDQWKDQGFTEYTRDWTLSAGNHSLKVEYYENGGGAAVALWWDRLTSYNRLIARHSGRCMDVYGGSRDNGASIIQWDCHTGDNQAWSLVPVGSYYELVVKHSGKCLDVYGGSRDNGASLVQWDCHGGDNQLFTKEQIGSYYRLRAKHSNRCIDVYGGSTGNGVRLIQWDCHTGNNQQWSIQQRTFAAQSDESVEPAMDSAPGKYIQSVATQHAALIEHTFQEGDSLELAAQVYQTTVDAILAVNPGLSDQHEVQPGTTIKMPVTVPEELPQMPYRLYLPNSWR